MPNNMNTEDYFIECDKIRYKLRVYAIISIIMLLIKFKKFRHEITKLDKEVKNLYIVTSNLLQYKNPSLNNITSISDVEK